MIDALPADYTAFIGELVEGLAIDSLLYRGRRLDLPVLETPNDRLFDVAAYAKGGPLVLAFYPGGWCPRSRALLEGLEARRRAVERAAARLAAVTVERPSQASRTFTRTGIGFPIAIDHAARFIRALGLSRKMPTTIRRQMRDAGIRLKDWNGEGSFDLPLPALVVVDGEGLIRWADIAVSPAALALYGALQVVEGLAGGRTGPDRRGGGRRSRTSP